MPVLNSTELNILSAFAETLIPSTERIPQSPTQLRVAEQISHFLDHASSTVVLGFRSALYLLEWKATLFRFCGLRFTRMPASLRQDYLQKLFHSQNFVQANMLRLLEVFSLMTYYADAEISKTLGYEVKLPQKAPSRALYADNVVLGGKGDLSLEVDVCIIGSGAGGAPIAAELAEAGFRVAILEEGGRFDLSDYTDDVIHRSKRMYRDSGLTTTFGIPPIVIPLGKTIGGTTTINSGTCFRTPTSIFEKWKNEYHLGEFTDESMGPYFDRVEKTIHVTEIPEELLGNSARVIRRGLEKMGLHGAPLRRNAKSCEGSGLCCFGCPTDAKQSVQLNYIPRALSYGATLYGHCRVDQLISDGKKVTEVLASFVDPLSRKKTASLKVRAKTFILAAGTIGTPLLLKASRLGLKSGQVGKNLTIHPASKALALFDEKIRGWEGVPQSYSCSDYSDQGIMFEGAFTPPSLASSVLLLRGLEHKRVMEQIDHVASFGFLITDESRGRVWRRPNGEALITYFLGKRDLKKIVDGTLLLCRMFFEAGAKEVYLPIHKIPKITSFEETSRLYSENLKARDLEVLAFHPLGTCRMGTDPEKSVVNSYGRVHDLENLYITDGSVFPTSLGVNPQVTIMAFSTRTADFLKQK